MKSIKPATVASCLAAVLIGVALAEATLAEMPDRLTKSVDHQGHVPRTIAESGRFHCSLTTLDHLGVATVTADTLNERVAVEFSNWRSENSEIRIHRRLLDPIFLQNNGSVARDSEGQGLLSSFQRQQDYGAKRQHCCELRKQRLGEG